MIGQHEMVNKVVEIVQERQDMASSLRVRRENKGEGGGGERWCREQEAGRCVR